jgi:hypothetical protein
MSIFSDIPLERLATVFMRRDPKAMAFKIAVIEANVLMREFYKAEPGTYERALAWQSAGTAAHTAERLYLEAVNHTRESKEESTLPPDELEKILAWLIEDDKQPTDAACVLMAFGLTDKELKSAFHKFATQYAAKQVGIEFKPARPNDTPPARPGVRLRKAGRKGK